MGTVLLIHVLAEYLDALFRHPQKNTDSPALVYFPLEKYQNHLK